MPSQTSTSTSTESQTQPHAPDKTIPHERTEPRPDFSTPPAHKDLPPALQATLNDDEKLWNLFTSGKAPDSTTTDYRYAAYASRIRTILISAHRYVAYTSDIGESFRPVAHPWLIRSAYGVSWAYLIGDVAHEGYKAKMRNQAFLDQAAGKDADASATADSKQIVADAVKDMASPTPAKIPPLQDYRTVMAQRAVFQSIASMGLPAFTIHSIVKYSGKALKDAKNKTLRTWGPIGLGLAAVPALPFMFDKPVEEAVEFVFHKGFEVFGAAGSAAGSGKEKEL